ncbi:hypothetical protein C8J57DRAFT_1564668 [Mycena rebaudengoi]|nr:hypothetical protein C8J57DRAFT_1564668 [Mycena rebaudengoi]
MRRAQAPHSSPATSLVPIGAIAAYPRAIRPTIRISALAQRRMLRIGPPPPRCAASRYNCRYVLLRISSPCPRIVPSLLFSSPPPSPLFLVHSSSRHSLFSLCLRVPLEIEGKCPQRSWYFVGTLAQTGAGAIAQTCARLSSVVVAVHRGGGDARTHSPLLWATMLAVSPESRLRPPTPFTLSVLSSAHVLFPGAFRLLFARVAAAGLVIRARGRMLAGPAITRRAAFFCYSPVSRTSISSMYYVTHTSPHLVFRLHGRPVARLRGQHAGYYLTSSRSSSSNLPPPRSPPFPSHPPGPSSTVLPSSSSILPPSSSCSRANRTFFSLSSFFLLWPTFIDMWCSARTLTAARPCIRCHTCAGPRPLGARVSVVFIAIRAGGATHLARDGGVTLAGLHACLLPRRRVRRWFPPTRAARHRHATHCSHRNATRCSERVRVLSTVAPQARLWLPAAAAAAYCLTSAQPARSPLSLAARRYSGAGSWMAEMPRFWLPAGVAGVAWGTYSRAGAGLADMYRYRARMFLAARRYCGAELDNTCGQACRYDERDVPPRVCWLRAGLTLPAGWRPRGLIAAALEIGLADAHGRRRALGILVVASTYTYSRALVG